ncbi:ribosomal protein S18-alanine N-acetyltransferase [Altererythrobacter sp. Root672]|uniref:ribosomal protein S18-alanine N-acetyltransferase n=1 Tax=Altererythrobacter sp. Root672 TaxID=1736584 RepID=UPI0006FCF0EF|nr:ribosomal protein S18-alanine N-acetyltransferase [Altererythrobacter sp. Root672]KRA82917.1 ribosomal-protein-alanine acetyltransferase [Altererythrobacter sp. Root672]
MIDDLDRIMHVMDAAFDPAYGEAWSRGQVGDALVMPNTYYLLAGIDGSDPQEGQQAAGFALSRGAADEEELLLIAVDPAHQGKGIGSILMQRFIETAQDRGAVRLFLEMRDGNSAESLYRKYGFDNVGRRKHYYRRGMGTPLDAITFVLHKK